MYCMTSWHGQIQLQAGQLAASGHQVCSCPRTLCGEYDVGSKRTSCDVVSITLATVHWDSYMSTATVDSSRRHIEHITSEFQLACTNMGASSIFPLSKHVQRMQSKYTDPHFHNI
ncbi:hypothetical protein BsWGS_20026 [Bradybaena similaris]